MRRRRWFQYSLRSLLAVTLLCGAALGWVESRRRYYARQVAAAEACRVAQFDFERVGPDLLRKLWGKSAFRCVVSVYFHGNEAGELRDSDFDVIRRFPELQRIDMGAKGPIFGTPFRSFLTDDGLSALASLRRLDELNLDSIAIDGSGLSNLPSESPLRRLVLSHCRLSEQGLESIGRFTSIEELVVVGASVPTLEPLARLSNMRLLALSNCATTGLGFDLLAASPRLEYLALDRTNVTGDRLATIARSRTLKELDLTETDVTDADVAMLVPLRSLTHLTLSETRITSEALVSVAQLPRLEYLDLWGTKIGDDGLRHLSAIRTLRVLKLAQTRVSGAAVPTLARLKGLQELQIDGDRFSVEETSVLTKAIPTCSVDEWWPYGF